MQHDRLSLKLCVQALDLLSRPMQPGIRSSFVVLLILIAWTLPARTQDSINLDFTVAQTEQSDASRQVATPTIASSPQVDKQDDRNQDAIALSFAIPKVQAATMPPPSVRAATPAVASSDLFVGGSDSLVARTVGHAEGTRTVDGSKTRAYYGHSDPGNGVWNLGSFSYQHAAQSPEDADEKQLRRLQAQTDTIRQRAAAHRLALSLEDELNAVDLANQSPLAALDTPGYIEWLKQARDRGLTGSDAVLWARTQSYWDVRRHRWDAPGLGNVEGAITHDQTRRLTAIARALNHYQQQQVAQQQERDRQDKVANKPPQAQIAEQIIFQDLSRSKAETFAQANR